MQIPVKVFEPHRWHLEVLTLFDAERYNRYMLNWHRRSRKTTLAVNLLIREAFKHPKRVYGYIAPTYKQAKRIVWTDPNMLFKYLPKGIMEKKNEQELYVKLTNGSIIQILGADDPDSIRGVDFWGVVFDEFAVMRDETIYEEIVRPILMQDSRRWAMFIFTPKGAENHAYRYWNSQDEWYKSVLTARDSKIIPEKELDKMQRENEVLYRQEMMCEFIADEEMVLITSRMLAMLNDAPMLEEVDKSIIACDPSEGGDECVIYAIRDAKITSRKILRGRVQPMVVAGEIISMRRQEKIKKVIIDNIGVGSGIEGRLGELIGSENVIGFRASERSNLQGFKNLRAEAWWYAMEQIRDGKVAKIDDDKLRGQLCNVRYKVVDSSGTIQIEGKKEIKKRIGISPDRADAYVMGIWGLQFVNSEEEDEWIGGRIKRIRHIASRAGW